MAFGLNKTQKHSPEVKNTEQNKNSRGVVKLQLMLWFMFLKRKKKKEKNAFKLHLFFSFLSVAHTKTSHRLKRILFPTAISEVKNLE